MARIGLGSNLKFRRLTRSLGSTIIARGALELLWEPSYESGDPYIGTSDDIEALVGWTGARGALTAALLGAGASKGAGFIEPYAGAIRDAKEPHYQIHDFFHHCPEYVKSRASRERERTQARTCAHCHGPYHSSDTKSRFCGSVCRAAAWRAAHEEQKTDAANAANQTQNDEIRKNARNIETCERSERSVTNCNATPTPTPTPTPTQEDQERLQGDADALPAAGRKKRLAIKQPGLLDDDARAPDEVLPADAPLLEFPIDGVTAKSKRTTWPLMQAQVDEWAQTYQTLDIPNECRRAWQWVRDNPSKRKTYGGMPAFLNNWFSKSVNTRARAPTGFAKSAGNIDAGRQWIQEQAAKYDREG